MGEREPGHMVHVSWRGRSEEVKELRSRLMQVASLPARAMVTSEPGLMLGLMSGSMALM